MCHILVCCDCSWGRPELSCCETSFLYATHALEILRLTYTLFLVYTQIIISSPRFFSLKRWKTEAVEQNTLEQSGWQPEKSRCKLKCGYCHMSVRKHWQWSRILKNLSDFWNIIDKILLKRSCIRRFWTLLACRLGRQNQIVCVGEGNVLFLLSNRPNLSHSSLAGLTLQCLELTDLKP